MKFRSLHKWSNIEGKENLIFSAQLLEEMLFHYTIDTYKPSVMDTALLINEALETIAEVEKGNIKEPNIKHVLAELCDCLDKDYIAEKLINLSKDQIFFVLKNPKSNRNKIKNILEILKNSVDDIKYKEELEKEIIKLSLSSSNEFHSLRRLVRNYITCLISHGYHPYFIREEMLDFFWQGNNNEIIDGNCLQKFFDKFSFRSKNYHVYVVVDKIFTLYTDIESIGWLKFCTKEQLPHNINNHNFLRIGENETFCIFNKINNIDPYSARESAEKILKLSADLINIFHHKRKPIWQNKFMVLDADENKVFPVNQSIPSMLKCIDLKEPKAKLKIHNFVKSFSLDGNSYAKFINSIRLHSMALHSDSVENQLLNLWVALESLVPSDTQSTDESNIEHIINSLIPFLNIVYFSELIDNLVKDLIRWNFYVTRKALKDIHGNSFKIKLINLLTNSDYNSKLAELFNSTREFYLLKDRLEYFQDIFSSKKKINFALEAHSRRLEWQIRRIYRTRNLIVHTGVSPHYIATLIEHTHSYLDMVLNVLIALATNPSAINSVGQGFEYVALLYKTYCKNCCSTTDTKLNDEELNILINIINFR